LPFAAELRRPATARKARMLNTIVLFDFEMKNASVRRRRDAELVRRRGSTYGGTRRLLLARERKTMVDDVLSVVSPGVRPILKIVLVGRIAKLPEQLKLTSVDGWVNGWTKRCAVVGVRRAAIAAIGRGGARIGHCEHWLFGL
jgi:hypothetical protein